jgi:MYXO-CTERM domain-containing protein
MARPLRALLTASSALLVIAAAGAAAGQTVSIDTSARQQTIDGFGTCLSGSGGTESWFQKLYFDDLKASMLRVDLTPTFKSPYSDFTYNSPWYHNNPPLPGPDGNNVRTYTSAADYTKTWAGRSAQIAVMGPDIDANAALIDFTQAAAAGAMAQLGASKKADLGDFKLFASMWSPAPWLKLTSGNTYSGGSGNLPANGTPWPFIWGGNFAGGKLDVSGTPRAEFDDGSGPTSALTQFARGLAAYLHGFQTTYGVQFYAISIQNELNFEEFYNSMTYPLAAGYIAALKAARAELDKHPDLAGIKIMGPEDLMGGDAYSMWQYGGGSTTVDKNLQYLAEIAKDPDAASALSYFCIHGYDSNGASAAGGTPQSWLWWVNGWTSSPAAGIPADVQGVAAYQKKSWMTETSGEDGAWLSPSSGFPSNGAFSIALKLHQALTTGNESGWAYWQLSDGNPMSAQTLTDQATGASSPKYVAVKHFFSTIRPNAVRVGATVTGADALYASAYVHDADGTLTVILVNASASAVTAAVEVPASPAGITSFDGATSSDGSYWQTGTFAVSGGTVSVPVPGYGVVSLQGKGKLPPPPGTGGSGGGGAGGASTGVGAGGAGTGGKSATSSGSTGAGGSGGTGAHGGCKCEISGADEGSRWALPAIGALAAALRRRRRR